MQAGVKTMIMVERQTESMLMDVMKPLEQLITTLTQERAGLMQRHPTWQARDARVTIFAKYANTLRSVYLGLLFQHEQLSHRQWWKQPHFTAMEPFTEDAMTDDAITNQIREFDRFLRVGCIQMLVSALESSLFLFLLLRSIFLHNTIPSVISYTVHTTLCGMVEFFLSFPKKSYCCTRIWAGEG